MNVEKSSPDEVIMSNQGERETMPSFSKANKLPELLQPQQYPVDIMVTLPKNKKNKQMREDQINP